MITIEVVHCAAGLVLGAASVGTLLDRTHASRYTSAFFWGTYAVTLIFGSRLSEFVNGCLVIALVIAGGAGGLGRGTYQTTLDDERVASAKRFGNRLFFPALLVPAGTILITLGGKGLRIGGELLVEPKNLSLIALGFSSVVALAIAAGRLRQPPVAAVHESRRLLDLVGWAAILPQMLASLGALFAAAGVGDRFADLLGHFVPLTSPLVVACTYTVGMALFTVILGNAFAAFPIMTAAVGLPLVVRRFGADPAAMAAIGMLSGFCGTLMTPMAANFNIVPAALLELPDRNAIIRVQLPTALLLLSVNTALMYFFSLTHHPSR